MSGKSPNRGDRGMLWALSSPIRVTMSFLVTLKGFIKAYWHWFLVVGFALAPGSDQQLRRGYDNNVSHLLRLSRTRIVAIACATIISRTRCLADTRIEAVGGIE